MTPPNPQNRRRHERFFLLASATLTSGGRQSAVQVINRSKGGAYVLSPLTLPLQAAAELVFALPGEGRSAHLACRVARVDRFEEAFPYQSGVRLGLARAEARSRERWLEFSRELSEGVIYGQPMPEGEDSVTGRTSRRPELLLEARLEVGRERLAAKVTNVGGHGVSLLVPRALAEGAKGLLDIHLPDIPQPARFPAELTWSRPSTDRRVGLGLEIVRFEGEAQALWESHVQEDIITLF